MIDQSGKYWHGDSANDIDEYLIAYTEEPTIDVKPVVCHSCQHNVFELRIDRNESVIQVKCTQCGTKKILLDGEELWADAKPRLRKCTVCKTSKEYHVKVGLIRRNNGDVNRVYIGNRCTHCGVLGSYLDWNINYGPTDEMEKNI